MTEFELDPDIEWIAREARRPVAVAPEARERLMAAIRAEAPPRRVSVIGSLFAFRPVRMSPSMSAALAAGLVGVGMLLGSRIQIRRDNQRIGQPLAAVANGSRLPASDTVFTFVVVAPGAATVSVVGDFNQWNASATPMTRIENSGAWQVSVPMAKGRHVYSFHTVGKDGERWLADPHAPSAPDDGFGRANSVLIVGKGSAL